MFDIDTKKQQALETEFSETASYLLEYYRKEASDDVESSLDAYYAVLKRYGNADFEAWVLYWASRISNSLFWSEWDAFLKNIMANTK